MILLNLFEKELNRQLKFDPAKVRVIFIPVSREQIVPLLTSGHADYDRIRFYDNF
jgi:hypothetical protein